MDKFLDGLYMIPGIITELTDDKIGFVFKELKVQKEPDTIETQEMIFEGRYDYILNVLIEYHREKEICVIRFKGKYVNLPFTYHSNTDYSDYYTWIGCVVDIIKNIIPIIEIEYNDSIKWEE